MFDTEHEQYLAVEAVPDAFCADDATIDFTSVDVVSDSEVPDAYTDYFGADEFYRLTATVARPIRQPYVKNGTLYHFKKPAEELQKAAWSLDNKPWTLGHPETENGMVASTTDVRGFWKDPQWKEGPQDLDADLYFPTTDEEARSYLEETGEVSIGARHGYEIADEEEDIDAYQTDLYFDHVASVQQARCPSEKGCGINEIHAHTDEMDGELLTDSGEDIFDVMDGCESTDGCGCGCGGTKDTTNMSDDNQDKKDFVIEEMAVDSLRQRNDNVEEALVEREDTIDVLESKVEQLEEQADEAVDAFERGIVLLGLDSEESVDADEFVSEFKELKETKESLVDEVGEYRQEERKDLETELQGKTDLSNDDLEEMSIDELRDKVEFLDHVATDASASGVHSKGADTNIETTMTNINPNEMGD